MTLKQTEVTILGQVYVLGCPEGGEASLDTAVATVDREMRAIRAAGKVRARERIAVLAALNGAFQRAERGASAPQAEADPATPERANSAAVDDLIRRVDAALGNDGLLL